MDHRSDGNRWNIWTEESKSFHSESNFSTQIILWWYKYHLPEQDLEKHTRCEFFVLDKIKMLKKLLWLPTSRFYFSDILPEVLPLAKWWTFCNNAWFICQRNSNLELCSHVKYRFLRSFVMGTWKIFGRSPALNIIITIWTGLHLKRQIKGSIHPKLGPNI